MYRQISGPTFMLLWVAHDGRDDDVCGAASRPHLPDWKVFWRGIKPAQITRKFRTKTPQLGGKLPDLATLLIGQFITWKNIKKMLKKKKGSEPECLFWPIEWLSLSCLFGISCLATSHLQSLVFTILKMTVCIHQLGSPSENPLTSILLFSYS